MMTEPNPVQHAKTRKIFLPAFSDRALTQQAQLFTKYVDQLIRILKQDSSKPEAIDMGKMYNCTTFDIMGDLTFGESLHMLDNAEYDPWGMLLPVATNTFSMLTFDVKCRQFSVLLR